VGLRDGLLLTDRSNADVDELNRVAQNRRLRTGDIAVDGLLVESSARGDTRTETLHTGDAVVLTRHVRRPGSSSRLESGTCGEVTSHDASLPSLEVRFGDRVERLDGDDVSAARLGYARHVYSAQSRTVDRVYAVIGGWQTHRQSAYVAVSRARDAALIVSDYPSLGVTPGDRDAALQALGRRISVSMAKEAAMTRDAVADRRAELCADELGGREDSRREAARLARLYTERNERACVR
jgi:ATP-dependent exoDNAse (exonuclease V) alpha subunit